MLVSELRDIASRDFRGIARGNAMSFANADNSGVGERRQREGLAPSNHFNTTASLSSIDACGARRNTAALLSGSSAS